MSSTNPPEGPGPDQTGQQPEYLEHDGGSAVGSTSGTSGGSGRRTGLLVGGGLVAVAVVGAGVWAATSFFSTGAQPAEALPAGTLGYASIDLDPSGGQKIEAFKMLNKFPAIKDELRKAALSPDDDLKAKLFESAQEDGACPDVTYSSDVAPWLGDRFAVAAVDLGDDQPTPVGVVQVTDADAAEDGLAKLKACASDEGASNVGGWAIEGDWAVIAQTEDQADQVTEAAADGSLSDDEDFQKWTDEVGDAGVLNLYAAPEAGSYLAELMQDFPGMMGTTVEQSDAFGDDPAALPVTPTIPPALLDQLKDFKGMAATLRFDDGALELEVAGDQARNGRLFAGDNDADVVGTLPADTAAVFGLGLADNWGDTVLSTIEQYAGVEGAQVDDMIAQAEAATGLTLPDDLETLLGESASVSVSSSLDPEAFVNSSDGSDVPVGLKVEGDAGAIQAVLDKITTNNPGMASVLGSDAEGDHVAIGPNPDYRAELLRDGGLGDTDAFQNVVREGDDANVVLFVNFDAGDWLTKLAGQDPEAVENLEPLEGFGMSAWVDDDVSHSVVRLTTD